MILPNCLAGIRRCAIGLAALAMLLAPNAFAASHTVGGHRAPFATPAGMRGSASLITYTMPGTTRRRVTASTLLFVPDGAGPERGWPVVLWSHGSTTPGYRNCAPSLSPELDGGLTVSGLKSDYRYEITALVNAGYAVVAPDFEGIGAAADAPNPGFNSRSIANALIFGLRAARLQERTLSDRFVAVGHSEGARALVTFDQIAARERDLHQLGTVALAPFSSIRSLVSGLSAAPGASDATNTVVLQNFIVALVATGLKVQTPSFDERQVMGADLAAVFPRLRTLCAADATNAVAMAVKEKGADRFTGLRADWADQPDMKAFLAQNDPAEMPNLTIAHPMLVVVGSADPFVPIAPLTRLVERQRANGADITLDVRPGGDHFSIIRDRQQEILGFVAAAFAKGAAS